MKISLNKKEFITDNSLEIDENAYFVLTNSNSKFLSHAQTKTDKIIRPSEALKLLNLKPIEIIGITGTNGKTTSASLIAHILNVNGIKTALAGTRGAFLPDRKIAPKGLTTSQFLETLNYLKQASEAGCKYFVMEVSSHAIAQNRIEALEFSQRIFTNLSQDHLDFHKTFEEYARTKSKFFQNTEKKIINLDDENINYIKTGSKFYSLKDPEADYFVSEYDLKQGIKACIKFKNEELKFNAKLEGKFNLYNILCAFSSVYELGILSLDKIKNGIESFEGVAGRMEVVSTNPLIIVDFAHTPDGIEKVLSSLEGKKLVVIFGAGGDRDKTKRPLMAKAVSKYAYKTIVTSDNPRTENPLSIIEDIKKGFLNEGENIFYEEDRKKAITLGLSLIKNDEVLVILGKGDEETQEINGEKFPFSDKEVVLNLLKRR